MTGDLRTQKGEVVKNLRKVIVSCLISLLMVTPSTYGTSILREPVSPLNYDVLFSLDDGKLQIAIKRVASGYLLWRADREPANPKLITDAEIAELTVVEQESYGDWATMRAEVSDGLGGSREYVISERLDGDRVVGQIEVPGQGVLPYTARFARQERESPGRGPRLRANPDWFIFIGAGVILAAGCVINAIKTDCAGDCSAGCGDSGMKSSDEGLCGQCDCECKT